MNGSEVSPGENEMLLTVEGTYSNGRVELREEPPVQVDARVIVTFLESSEPALASDRELLRQRAIERMERGLPLGGSPYPSREEIHDRQL